MENHDTMLDDLTDDEMIMAAILDRMTTKQIFRAIIHAGPKRVPDLVAIFGGPENFKKFFNV